MSRPVRVPKRQLAKRGARGRCECTSHMGEPKVLYPEHWQASRSGGNMLELWEVYKCPAGGGWHLSTVRSDPWKKSQSVSPPLSAEVS